MLSEVTQATSALNDDLLAIHSWAKSFGLIVNPAKSQAMIVGSGRLRCKLEWSQIPPLVYEGTKISYTDKVKNLGLIMDSTLSWTSHINDISRRMYFSYHSLKRLQYFLPFNTKIMLAQSILLPILDYADVCFLDVTEELLNKLERLQNLAIRFIFSLRKYDHVSEYRTRLKWLPIRHRHETHVLAVLYNILNNPNSPSYLRSRFQLLPPPSRPRRLCLNQSRVLKLPCCKTHFMGNSFAYRAVQLWNKLPVNIQNSPSSSSFKKRLKSFYLSNLI